MLKTVLILVLFVLCGCYVVTDYKEYDELAQLGQSLTELDHRIKGKDLKLPAEISGLLGTVMSVANSDLAEYVQKASIYNARRPAADNPLRPYLWVRNLLTPLPPPFASPLDAVVR